AFRMAITGHRPIEDAMLALTCHGALTRNPELRILSIENGASWVPGLFENLTSVYKKMPQEFGEDPVEAFKRCVYISPFWEDNFVDIAKLVGPDRVVFGSDWPHPEGLKDPITYVDDLEGLSQDEIARIMGGNMIDLFKLKVPAGV
ncbi:MAG: amidohydrolase family protein, partial [Mycobacteriales bacterium]